MTKHQVLKANLATIKQHPALLQSLTRIQRGIERECLRISNTGNLAQTDHPYHLGSALSHPKITTDYSESLLEFITPVHQSVSGVLQSLNEVHRFTYQTLAEQDELIWSASMPNQLGDEKDIPIAKYGNSNVAKMKNIYRHGLGLRYSRHMQTIAGIHYNFSLPDKFWANYQHITKNTDSAELFRTEKYFGLIRNFRRVAPLFVYLQGASPALSKSFLQDQNHQLEVLDSDTLYSPYATSLRMSDLGYQSSAQEQLFVCYNSLENYIDTLKAGINTSYPDYSITGIKSDNGQYQQLNDSLLQIENEFYSIVRPKRVAASGEAPLNALARAGVEYIEIRCIDIDPYSPTGIDEHTLRFLDLLLLYCLFSDSPQVTGQQCSEHTENLKTVVDRGREPGLNIKENGINIDFKQWCEDELKAIQELALILDSLRANNDYTICINKQLEKVATPSLTPSAEVLSDMRRHNLSFNAFGLQQSKHWQTYFSSKPLTGSLLKRFSELAENSHAQQKAIEAATQIPFDEYLEDFYLQYR